MIVSFRSPCGRYVLTVEDDGKVAYAYLKCRDDVVGDVWLYNRCPTPDDPEWHDRSKIPFANSRAYASERGRLETEVKESDINVDWESEHGVPVAFVYIARNLYGVVGVDDKPGYARFAVKDGPLARVMIIDHGR